MMQPESNESKDLKSNIFKKVFESVGDFGKDGSSRRKFLQVAATVVGPLAAFELWRSYGSNSFPVNSALAQGSVQLETQRAPISITDARLAPSEINTIR